ncbi:MAG: type II toxin-antitoxin system HipA family toxin [Verrucomicrobia bacterium]|nr:type II toxin-antitoxin system HipA family toxin [Verrucomicrobiota bacterium]
MTETLHLLHGEEAVGILAYDRRKDQITLSYEEAWQFGTGTFPVSLALPLARKTHPDERVRPYLQGLLPDNPAVIEAWGKRFKVSPRNPFDIIKHVGEDCAGALLFVRPERRDLILAGELDRLTPLSDGNLARRMDDLRAQARAIPVVIDGRFSLAGAQTKDALHWQDGRWHVPAGRIPSTHILKPELEEFDEHALNEHFCLQLASRVGLPAAESRMLPVAGKNVLCVRRYDRIEDPRSQRVLRIHQEDTCQALGLYPHQKYQADGGPSAAGIVNLLERYADDAAADIRSFVMALALNWVIAGTDAHSKNYSLLHGRDSILRLAPLYDLASYLPYQRDPLSTKVKLAMKLGGTYRLRRIDATHWRAWALEAGLAPDLVTSLVRTVVEKVAQAVAATREALAATHDCAFLETLAAAIDERALHCAVLLP